MKKGKQIVGLLVIAALLGGCGTKSETAGSMASYDMAPAESPAAGAEVWETEEAAAEESGMDAGNMVTATTGIESVNSNSQKLIKTVSLNMETKEFDELLAGIETQVEEMNGYIENSSISGNSYYNSSGTRYAWLTLRIPAERLDSFITIVEELGNVTSKNESVDDITLQYVDVESHKKALETEQERLLELLEKAESMEDIITIESRLSEVRYELQSYESRLRTYDNKVNYSTVSIDICEVERVSRTPEKKTFFGEIKERLSDNFYDIGQGIRSFAIWFISSLPYLVIWAAVIFVIVKLVRKIFWKKPFFRKKEQKDTEKEKIQEKG